MIKSFHLRDSWLVARLQRVGTSLDLEEQLTHPRSPLRSVLLDTLFCASAGPSTFILNQPHENGRQLGLAQVRTRPGRSERDVVFMSPALDAGNGSHAIWQRLLTHLCVKTAERGGLRVYARLPKQSEELHLFRNVGFFEYGQEYIFQLDKTVNRANLHTDIQLRPQQPTDGWGLQKLYATLTPRAVQNAEGLAQGQWALTHHRWGEQGRRYGYVWEVGSEIVGALHIRAGKCGHWIRTLLHPDALENSEDLGKAALQLTGRKPKLPVYFAFRHYEAGWQHTLPTLGFAPLTSQKLVVKSMTVRVREKSNALISTALEASPPEGASPTMLTRVKTTSNAPQKGRRQRQRQE